MSFPSTTSSPSDPRPIIALVSAYNEGDVIAHVIGDLIANGLQVYLIDNSSTDNTAAEASQWLGKGLLRVERFPDDAGYSARCSKEYVWKQVLARKEELATELNGAWFIHADADEFRESPWPGKSLAEAILEVDRLGFNAINFELYNFRPTDDAFVPGTDVRSHLKRYQPGELFNSLQIKAWKNTGVRVQLAANAGHSVGFPNRQVFPLNFILRHYPIRGETHGRRKVFTDRLPRFAKEEVAGHWHVQYNEYVDGRAKFLHRMEDLSLFDGNKIRAELLSRFTADLMTTRALGGAVAIPDRISLPAVCAYVSQKLGMSEPLAPEVWHRTDVIIGQLLPSQQHGPKDLTQEIDPPLARLLIVVLDIRLAFARLLGNSHLAYLADLLKQALQRKLTCAPVQVPPPARDPEKFNAIMQDAKNLVKAGRFQEAIAQTDLALELAPTPEGVVRVKEIQALLRNLARAA